MSDDISRSGPQGSGPDEVGDQELPPGVEGTRGPKDSAEQARRHYMEQRGMEPIDAPTSGPPVEEGGSDGADDDVPSRGGSFGATFDDAERALALERLAPSEPAVDGAAAADEVDVQALTVSISGARTSSQAGTQTAFLRTTDALALVLDVVASQDLVSSGRRFDANFQILDYQTNAVRRSVWTRNSAFSWGTHFWISQGNNWGPAGSYTTPEKWGLPVGVYALRGTIEVLGAGAFAYSVERQFRVR